MKKLWKLALVAVFALVLAIPMALTGCGTEKFTINFETEGVFRQGDGYQVSATAFGNVDTNKVTGVKQGSKFSVNGNTLTIGGQTVTATPIDSSRTTDAYTYQFKEWKLTSFDETSDEDITTKKVASNIIVKAVFERVAAVYTVTFDTNGVDVGQEIPTIQVTYGQAIAAEQLPNIDVPGYTLKTSSGNNGGTGWSIDKNATISADTLGKQTALKPGELDAAYRTAMNYTSQAGLTEEEFYEGLNEGTKYYLNNSGTYTEATTFEAGKTYYTGTLKHTNVQTNIDYVNKTITLYAVWDEYYVNVRLWKLTEYRLNSKKVDNNKTAVNDADLKVKLQVVGSDETLESDTYAHFSHEDDSNTYRFGALAMKKADGTNKQYKVFVETATGSGVYADTGVTLAPTFSGSMQNFVANVYYAKLDIETTEGIESVTGYDANTYYLAGTQLTLTAHVAAGYTFNGWEVKSLTAAKNGNTYELQTTWGDFAGSTSEEVTITIPSVYTSANNGTITTIYYKVSATA